MQITAVQAPVVAPPVSSVTLVLSASEAAMLRRACYYNKTVGEKFGSNPVGGYSKGKAVKNFLGELGNSLKAKGINRY